jgi:uncharacterized flavoprotein (TIGR03862 family)
MPTPARKFLIAGRGGLNLNHSEPLSTFIARYGDASSWLAPSLHRFTPQHLRSWCEGLGIETFIGTSGRVFPTHMKAVQLLRAWLARLALLEVTYAPRHQWIGWKNTSEGRQLAFLANNQETVLIKPDATLLALGGASWPRLGSNGAWTKILANEHIELAPLRPANCGFHLRWSDYFKTHFAGMPLKSITVSFEGISHQGEAMVTQHGIEGGVIYALSTALRNTIERTEQATITLDLRPHVTNDDLMQKLQKQRGSKSLSTFLKRMGFSSLEIHLLRETMSPVALAQATPDQLAKALKNIPLTLQSTSGLARAISTAGGIKREALDDSFMLHALPSVFAAGEMLDWEAPTGGYLLQACFSTAVAAAHGIMNYCAQQDISQSTHRVGTGVSPR